MDVRAKSWQENLVRCLAGTRTMPCRAGSASHSQPGKAQLQILLHPSQSSVPIGQVSLEQQLSCTPGSRTASMAGGKAQFHRLPNTAQTGTATGNSLLELCSCLQTLMSTGSFLAWLCWTHCQSGSGMRPGTGMPWPGRTRNVAVARKTHRPPDSASGTCPPTTAPLFPSPTQPRLGSETYR